MHTNKRANRDR